MRPIRSAPFENRLKLACILAIAGCGRAYAEPPGSAPIEPKISRIVFLDNRTVPEVLRRRLPFTEGDALSPQGLQTAREGLFKMQQFRAVFVSSASAPDGSAEITFRVKDGWYLIPIPFFSLGSGGSRGGLVVAAQNIFKHAESFTFTAMSGPTGKRAAFQTDWDLGTFSVTHEDRDYRERHYTDGGFSTAADLRAPADQDPSDYGTVLESYRKHVVETDFSLRVPLIHGDDYSPTLAANLGWEHQTVAYDAATAVAPSDTGRHSKAFAGFQFGKDGAVSDSGIGAILGFGMADLKDRVKPLAKKEVVTGGRLRYYLGESWTGSDFSFGYALARWDSAVTWGRHKSIIVHLAGGQGRGLPADKLLETGPETGLQGSYARVFRADATAGASVEFSNPFRITNRGIWQGILFVEGSRAWLDRGPKDKIGGGASFWYRFWRFPLPLGLCYTYSVDDRDSQISAALGGRF